MDRRELKTKLNFFLRKCKEKDKPLEDICIIEAFPGDISTSFIIQVKAHWIEDMYCSEVLNFLFDTLWETTDSEFRKNIFSIQVLDKNEKLHCESANVEDSTLYTNED